MTELTFDRPVEVLLVEDNPGDIRWTREMLKDVPTPTRLTVTNDGVEAMEVLRLQRPDVVLLDLQLPRKHGLEVLTEIAADDELRQIPVGILATSENQKDVEMSFARGAISYIAKPVDSDRLALLIAMIAHALVTQTQGEHSYQLTQEDVIALLF